mmetsp:Transcript_115382/g.331142  ORF Transcript_115382/g.331142 Transcript_115382/m.331142 type:complete len:356 (-) Transcript_115382:30-1097(-)
MSSIVSGKRFSERRADSAAESVLSSFATVGGLAIARELETVVAGLKQNPPVLFAVSPILADQPLAELISDQSTLKTLSRLARDGTLRDLLHSSLSGDASAKGKGQGDKRQKLRLSCKKLKHLRFYKPEVVLEPTLLRLNNTLFTKPIPPEWNLLEILAWALRCSLDMDLPHTYLDKGGFLDDLIDIFAARHQAVGSPLSAFATKEDFQRGGGWYFMADRRHIGTCLSEVKVDVSFGEAVLITNQLDFGTEVVATIAGKPVRMELWAQFEEAGVPKPALLEEWDLPAFEKRVEQPADGSNAGAASVAGGSVAGSTPMAKRPRTDSERAQCFSASLRRRLSAAGSSGSKSTEVEREP